jgi:hypothetical protein
MGILGIWVAGGGWVRWRMAGGGVLVVGEAVGGGGCGWILDLGRRGTEVRGWGMLYGRRGKWGKGGKTDLKAGHAT